MRNLYENQELEREEEAYLLQRLLTMTAKGQIVWHCTYFAPVSFMMAQDEGGADPFWSQLFTVQCHLNGVGWELSISETIKMPSGVGEVRIMGEQENGQHRRMEALYIGNAKTQTILKEKEQEQFCDPVVAQLAGTILRQIEESDAALESYIWAAFNLMRTVLEQMRITLSINLVRDCLRTDRHWHFISVLWTEPIAKCGWPLCEGRQL